MGLGLILLFIIFIQCLLPSIQEDTVVDVRYSIMSYKAGSLTCSLLVMPFFIVSFCLRLPGKSTRHELFDIWVLFLKVRDLKYTHPWRWGDSASLPVSWATFKYATSSLVSAKRWRYSQSVGVQLCRVNTNNIFVFKSFANSENYFSSNNRPRSEGLSRATD